MPEEQRTKMKAAKGQLVLKRIYKQLKKNPNSSSKEIQVAKAAYLAAKSNRAVVKKAQSAGETKEVTSVRSTVDDFFSCRVHFFAFFRCRVDAFS